MREVDGFVFIGQSPDPPNDIFLIGPSIDNEKQKWWNFCCNGLTPFEAQKEAEEVARDLCGTGSLTNFRLARIKMTIAENSAECLEIVRQNGPWVVISDIDGRQELRGEYREGCFPRAIPGGDLQMNGLVPLNDPNFAIYVRSECQRQFQTVSRISTFVLEIIKSLT